MGFCKRLFFISLKFYWKTAPVQCPSTFFRYKDSANCCIELNSRRTEFHKLILEYLRIGISLSTRYATFFCRPVWHSKWGSGNIALNTIYAECSRGNKCRGGGGEIRVCAGGRKAVCLTVTTETAVIKTKNFLGVGGADFETEEEINLN